MNEDKKDNEAELDEMLEDIEIEEELQQEEKLRKKNAKILLISIIGLLTIAGVYFGINYYNELLEEQQLRSRAGLPVLDQSDKEILPLQEEMKRIEDTETTADSIIETNSTPPSSTPTTAPDKLTVEKESELPEPPIQEEVKKEPPPPPEETPSEKSIDTDKTLTAEAGTTGKYYVQLGIFVVKENAEKLTRSLIDKGFSPSNIPLKEKITLYRVYAGDSLDKKSAKKEINNLKKAGITAILQAESGNLYTLQAGSFYIKKNAEGVKTKIIELGLPSKIVKISLKMDVHKVYVGYFKTKKEAISFQQKLAKHGYLKTAIRKG